MKECVRRRGYGESKDGSNWRASNWQRGGAGVARLVGIIGSTEPGDGGADAGNRSGSGEVSCCAALDDSSRSRFADGASLCADHRRGGTVSVWQADRGLSGAGAGRKLQLGKPTAGTYQQTGEWVNAFLPGGSGASHSPERWGVAQQVFPSFYATRTQDCEGGHGTSTRGSSVLDVAQ